MLSTEATGVAKQHIQNDYKWLELGNINDDTAVKHITYHALCIIVFPNANL